MSAFDPKRTLASGCNSSQRSSPVTWSSGSFGTQQMERPA